MTSLTEHYSDSILTKANRLIAQGKVERVDATTFAVAGSKTYRVNRIELGVDEDGKPIDDDGMPYVTCDCPNGLARGGRPNCYHSAAVIIALEKKIFDETVEAQEDENLEFDLPEDLDF